MDSIVIIPGRVPIIIPTVPHHSSGTEAREPSKPLTPEEAGVAVGVAGFIIVLVLVAAFIAFRN
jgi:hypothetical protein